MYEKWKSKYQNEGVKNPFRFKCIFFDKKIIVALINYKVV